MEEIKLNVSEKSETAPVKTIFKAISVNGRYGLEVVSSGFEEQQKNSLCLRAKVYDLGSSAGMDILRVEPTDEEQYVVIVRNSVKVEKNCRVIKEMNLQGNEDVSVLLCGEGAIFKEFGYKKRSSWFVSVQDEELKDVPAGEVVADKMSIVDLIKKEIKL